LSLLRRLILISSIAIAFVIGSNFSYFLLLKNKVLLTETTYSGVISGVGGFLGGVVGGLVAFGVSRSQFLQDKINEKNKQNVIYKNILRALLNELKHNKTIFLLISQSNEIDKNLFIESLEDQVWKKVKYDVNNFLDNNTYSLLDDHIREYSDLKKRILPDYKDLNKIDYKTRVLALEKITQILERKDSDIKLVEKEKFF
jgi:hypothetical protein